MADVSYKKGLSENLPKVPVTDGQILVTTDTGDMYVDVSDNNRKLIGAGKKTIAGGEIFNDYLTNRALSANSSVRGTNNIGGIKAFNVESFDTTTKTFTLDEVYGIEVGDVFSVLTDYHSALNIGKVTAIDTTNRKVTVDTIVDKSVGVSGTIEHFFIYTKPFIGTTAVRDGCTVEGTDNIAIGDYSHVEGRDNTTLDSHSHAEGRETKAIGNAAHSEGNITEAIGHRSHAEGRFSKAIGDDSHAEGNTTEAGFIAHAEGLETKAYGNHSHTEGAYTSTAEGQTGTCAHAEGHSTQANGVAAHAEGLSSQANGAAAHAEGEGSQANKAAAHAEGMRTIATGEGSHAEGTLSIVYPTATYPASNILQFTFNSSVPELFMPWDDAVKSKLWALVANRYSISSSSPTSLVAPLHLTIGDSIITCNEINKYTDTAPLGKGIAFSVIDVVGDIDLIDGGQYTVTEITERGEAVGDYSHSENNAYSKGNYSHAENRGISNGQYSHAEGNGVAIGESSHAEGNGVANSIYSHAEGESQATGQSSHAEGKGTASKMYAHAEGTGTASGEGSHAEGQGKALSYYSHAEGGGTASALEGGDEYQNGNFAHAESAGKAYGTRSHAENRGIAYYLDSHAENEGIAQGQGSHAEGTGTANHTFSHAANRGTITGRDSQTVVGQYNSVVSDAYFVVGDGTSSYDSGRRNAFVVKDDGSATLRTQGFDSNSIVTLQFLSNYPTYDSLSGYVTQEEFQTSMSTGLKREFVDVLPDAASYEDQNTIYMVKRTDNPSNNIYDEYIAVEQGWYKTGYSNDNVLLYIDNIPDQEPYEIYDANIIAGEISRIEHQDHYYAMAYKIKLQNKDKTIEVIEAAGNGSLGFLINDSISNYDTYKINIIPIENSEWSLYTLENTNQGDLTYYGKYYKIEVYKNMTDSGYEGPGFVFEKIGSTEINMNNYYTKEEVDAKFAALEASITSLQNI